MKLIIRISTILLALFISACAGSVDPSKLQLAQTDDKAVVMMKVPTGLLNYNIVVSQYDSNKNTIKSSSLNASGDYAVKSGNTNKYIGKLLKPGTYIFQEFYGQGHWSLCFHEDSFSFEVKPGEVLYLGEFYARNHMKELGMKAIADRNSRTSAVRNYYFDDISRPLLSSAEQNSAALEEVKNFVATSMPNVNVNIRVATFESASFNTGRGLIGDRMCGGLFTGSSKKKMKKEKIE